MEDKRNQNRGQQKPNQNRDRRNNHNNRDNDYDTKVFTTQLVLHEPEKDYQTLADHVKNYTHFLVKDKNNKVTTHQLRILFNKAIKQDEPKDVWKLEIDLVYLAGRNDSNKVFKGLTETLTRLIRGVRDEKTLENFKEFFKMLVAYHKYNEKFNANKF
ncbi:MAG: type III-A CRISPR-associated protein Csm2 [Bacteroidia bacterium]